jgi:hypothetical protein
MASVKVRSNVASESVRQLLKTISIQYRISLLNKNGPSEKWSRLVSSNSAIGKITITSKLMTIPAITS